MELEGRNKVEKLVVTAACTALLSVLSLVSIPLPTGVPVTLQTFAVALCGYLLGVKLGTVALVLYLALGAVGVPVFAGFSAGVGVFVGMTGGYLWGFLPMVALCGLGAARKSKAAAVALGAAGLSICHLCGVIQFSLVTSSTLWQSFLLASAPYLIKDVISVALAYLAAKAIALALKKAGVTAV